MYDNVKEYSFAVEMEIYAEMIGWLTYYGIPFEGSLEYYLPGVAFRMVTIKIESGFLLIKKDIDDALKTLRHNKRWEKSKA